MAEKILEQIAHNIWSAFRELELERARRIAAQHREFGDHALLVTAAIMCLIETTVTHRA